MQGNAIFRMKSKKSWAKNEKEVYAIIDEQGKIIEKFRNKSSAKHFKKKLEPDYFQELIVVYLPHEDLKDGRVVL